VFLDLLRIKLPLSGIVSILHRVSGVLMVLTIPIVAILFHQALSSPEGFAATAAVLDTWLTKLVLLGLLWALLPSSGRRDPSSLPGLWRRPRSSDGAPNRPPHALCGTGAAGAVHHPVVPAGRLNA
jgi:hypothetical protein